MMPTEFRGKGMGDDSRLWFEVIGGDGDFLTVQCLRLGTFWNDPVRRRKLQVGETFTLVRTGTHGGCGWHFDGPGYPWFCFNTDGTVESH